MSSSFHRWLLFCVASTGCVATETGNPLTVDTYSSDLSIATLDPSAGGVRVEQAWVSIDSVRAIVGSSCDHLDEQVARGATGDVVDGVVLEAPPVHESCGLHLVTSPLVDSDAPLGAVGSVAWVRGTRADGTAFELRATSTSGVDVIGESGLDLVGLRLVLSFDAAAWLRNVDLSGPPDADGVVRVGPASFDVAWLNSAELFVDTDRDGMLSDTERALGAVGASHL